MARASNSVSVNFKGVEGRGVRIKPGEYNVHVEEVELIKQKKPKDPYLKWIFVVNDGEDSEGAKIYFNTSLGKTSLWNLRGLLEALGEDVPDDEMDVDLEDLVDKECVAIVEMEEYEGKDRPKMVDYGPAEDAGGKKGKDKKGKDKKNKDKKLDREEVEGMDDRDDMEKLIKDNDLDVDPDDFKKDAKLLAAIIEELDEKELFEDDAGGKKGKDKKGGKASKLKKLSQDTVNDMDQDDLEEVNKDYDLDVDLDDLKSLKKMKAGIIDALENGGYLED